MRKINLIWIFALILLIPNTLAYTDCTTSACPSGYTDNGVVNLRTRLDSGPFKYFWF